MKTVAQHQSKAPFAVRPATRALPARSVLLSMTAVAALALVGGCASSGATSARYPRRAPGCELSVYHTAVPGIAAWDDLGVAEAVCNIGVPVAECLRQLRAEACRMGGDILYNVPRKPFRPREQVIQFRAQVAHTRQPGAARAAGAHEEGEEPPQKEGDLPPPASAEESAGPVTPLPSAHAPGAPEPPPEKEGGTP